MINRMLQGKQRIIYGDGEQKRCFSFVHDCVEPLVSLGTQPVLSGEVFNVSPDDEFISIRTLAAEIAHLLGLPLRPVFVAARAREVRFATCAAAKARMMLGHEPKTWLREGCRTMIEWIQRRGPGRCVTTCPSRSNRSSCRAPGGTDCSRA